ncbi:MAG TPA: acyl carrier protein [Clostridiales bacterium]|jgi:acyl carrier protein|nr:acyl carrier protein [Clostridiales bacterium]
MLEFIEKIVCEVAGRKGLTLDTDFVHDLHLNSFDIMNIVSAIEHHYKTRIPTRDIWQLRKVYQVIDYLAAKGYTTP